MFVLFFFVLSGAPRLARLRGADAAGLAAGRLTPRPALPAQCYQGLPSI